MKRLLVCVSFLVACGGNKPEPAPVTQPDPAPAQPDPNPAGGDACTAAGGVCTNVTAAVVCQGKPEAPCPHDQFCCVH